MPAYRSESHHRLVARLVACLVVIALVATSCGGGGDTETATEDANVVDAGSFRVELPEELTEVQEESAENSSEADTNTDTETAAEGAGADAETEAETVAQAVTDDAAAEETADDETAEDETEVEEDPDAIPLADDDDPIGGLFDAFDTFAKCMDRLGTEFIGAPDPSIPETQDPVYLADLGTCAAESNIVQALQDAETASANRTPEETELFNEGLLIFVDCMRGKGWIVADPVPDENGALQIGFGADAMVPPAGEEFLGNPNVRECGALATREAEALAAENS